MQETDDGDATCAKCVELGSQQRFMHKVTYFVLTMDLAKLLHFKMFKAELEHDFIEEIKAGPNYTRRHQTTYDWFFDMPVELLHNKMRGIWNGKIAQDMSESLNLFVTMYVRPCLDTEPGHSMKDVHLQRLLDYMSKDEMTGKGELEMVRSIVTGQLSRHPAFHGILVACMAKLRCIEAGNTTMRRQVGVLARNLSQFRVYDGLL